MDPTVLAALVTGALAIVSLLLGQWALRKRRGPTDRQQWDTERTAWMVAQSHRLTIQDEKLAEYEVQIRATQDALHECEMAKLDQDRAIDLLRVEITAMGRRLEKAGELLGNHIAGTDEAA